MSEQERAEQLKAIQLQLIELKKEYLLQTRRLKRQLTLVANQGLKRCRRCFEEMHVEQFYEDDRYTDGRYPYCRECKSGKAKAA